VIAVAAAALAVPLGLAAAMVLARRRNLLGEIGLLLPLGTSAVTVGFGMLLAFRGPPLEIRGEAWLVPVAHAVVALPFVVRALLPALRTIDPALREAAMLAGASPRRVLLIVDVPLAARATAVAAGFAVAISLGEFGATTFLARARHPTVPLLIERLLSQPGALNQAQAMALSCVLAGLVAGVVLLVDRWRTPGAQW
jgi:thiamine transport system permease protein